ncbi:hypothetical protein A6122_2243 [Rathayibacter tritici]|uniref:Uncharacterized protein n=2 Tax=Rathayibacter tritici TaxID=33888 RepID=A0A160KU43_9MICO|nr:RES domain-containing protein [Rathayibacter tritici]AND17366.1 hypothetical protein A6122_2243 [Rathayibacter tritici]
MSERLPDPDRSRFPALSVGHVRRLGTDVTVGRIYPRGGPHPIDWNRFRSFGPTGSRFDHHPLPQGHHPDHGVMYVAPTLPDARGRQMPALRTALVECFRDRGVIERSKDDPYFVTMRPRRALSLLDLADSSWITLAGGNAAISSGSRGAARKWAVAVYETYPDIDGLLYASSNLPAARSISLWERAADALPPRPDFHEPLSHAVLDAALESFARETGLDLVP